MSPQEPKVPADPSRRGWLPYPALSVLLAVVWLLLQQSVALPQLLSAVVLGVVVPRLVSGFLGPGTHPRRLVLALRFVFVVLYDIVVSNWVVARIVVNPASRPQPAWVEVPLEATDPLGITLLAAIITTTPGTVSCVVDDAGRRILVHALDCSDAAEVARQIKDRYERPLRAIFEGVDP